MKTSHVLIRLCILVFVLIPLLTTTEASAQPCGGATPCGTPPNCYAAPKVSGTAQLSHLITNYCGPTDYGVNCICDPGIFICITTDIPDGWSCSCEDAIDCKYINIRNLLALDGDCSNRFPKIDSVELRFDKDPGSPAFKICGPYTQWGSSPTWDDSTWILQYGSFTTANCPSWGGSTTKTINTHMPKGSAYHIETMQHWTAVVCGADNIEIRLHYIMDTQGTRGTSNWFTNLTVNTTACPEYGDDNGWCQ